MANTLTAYGALLDTAGSTLSTGFPCSEIIVTETGGSSGGVVTISDDKGTVITKVGVPAGQTARFYFGGRPNGIQFSTTGGTILVTVFKRFQ